MADGIDHLSSREKVIRLDAARQRLRPGEDPQRAKILSGVRGEVGRLYEFRGRESSLKKRGPSGQLELPYFPQTAPQQRMMPNQQELEIFARKLRALNKVCLGLMEGDKRTRFFEAANTPYLRRMVVKRFRELCEEHKIKPFVLSEDDLTTIVNFLQGKQIGGRRVSYVDLLQEIFLARTP